MHTCFPCYQYFNFPDKLREKAPVVLTTIPPFFVFVERPLYYTQNNSTYSRHTTANTPRYTSVRQRHASHLSMSPHHLSLCEKLPSIKEVFTIYNNVPEQPFNFNLRVYLICTVTITEHKTL